MDLEIPLREDSVHVCLFRCIEYAYFHTAEPEAVVHHMSVSLEDLYCGKTKKIQISSRVVCAGCKGYWIFVVFMF